jgi:hypothetical protein
MADSGLSDVRRAPRVGVHNGRRSTGRAALEAAVDARAALLRVALGPEPVLVSIAFTLTAVLAR